MCVSFFVVAIETKYDAEAALVQERKEKEKKIEKFKEALKSKKKMKSVCYIIENYITVLA